MQIVEASLAEETKKRYLNYALSVVTARALPDVRDGMKPVQRRILFGMHKGGHTHDEKYVKCARIVGDVMGKYHPHGDSAIYDALVRMAQDFTLRAPLVEGQGNFGSADGDGAAAMRYTEARLTKIAQELLSELNRDTVDFRPNYDGSEEEPSVLPARFPNLLINGSAGIAVGMATSIPPHNPGEILDATIALIDEPDATTKQLLKHVRGPDFPTGGQLVATKKELEEVYEAGQGSLKLQGTWKVEEPTGKGAVNPLLVLTSIPYAIERKTVVEKIAELIIEKKLPQLLDVRDESTEDTRIVCEVKKGTDPQLVVAYLFKHTPFQSNIAVNLTCIVPSKTDGQSIPARLGLREILRHFLDFRMEVVVRRLGFDLAQIRRRIHILEGFVTVFDALDETIRIIRKSEGKADAAKKLIARFGLSEEQTDAILELRLYRLAQLEINVIRAELDEKRKEETRLAQLLSSEGSRWKLIRAELHELRTAYGDKRTTKLNGEEVTYDAEAFIVDEDQFVLLSRQGWIKRQGSVKDLAATRVREGDAVFEATAGSTKQCVALFTSLGACFVCRIFDLPQTTGYGEPVQTIFKMADGERIVRMLSFDPRVLDVPAPSEGDGPLLGGGGGDPEPPYAVAITKGGLVARFSLRAHREPSTRAGRKYVRLNEGDEVIAVEPCGDGDRIACGTVQGHALVTTVDEVPVLAGAGKGVKLIRLEEKDDAVLGARVVPADATPATIEPLVIEHENGKTFDIVASKREVASRGGKGSELFKRGKAVRAHDRVPVLPVLVTDDDPKKKN